jgi:hypothetical protein
LADPVLFDRIWTDPTSEKLDPATNIPTYRNLDPVTDLTFLNMRDPLKKSEAYRIQTPNTEEPHPSFLHGFGSGKNFDAVLTPTLPQSKPKC